MNRKNIAASVPQAAERKYPTIMEIFEQGWGTDYVQTLTDSIVMYASALGASGSEMGKQDSENVANLVWLLKAVLKDCHGVDVS